MSADPSADPLFQDAIAAVLRHEGGFQKDPNDCGNWTGGRIGVGELKGTNFGISAAAYPALDIEHLTRADAIEIYYRDWWCRFVFFSELPHDYAVKAFDLAVNMGAHTLAFLLQRACNVCGAHLACDGIVGPLTITAAKDCDSARLLVALKREAVAYHEEIVEQHPAKAQFLGGWLARDME